MNVYHIVLKGCEGVDWIAETAGKAKYGFYLECDGCYEDFGTFLQNIESLRRVCKLPGRPVIRDPFFEEMANARDIPFAFLGMGVEVGGRRGRIVGANFAQNLDVIFDGESVKSNCHPWDNIVYYDDNGNEIARFD